MWVEMVNELPAEKLRRECDASFMRCETTQQLVPLQGIIGQERAVRSESAASTFTLQVFPEQAEKQLSKTSWRK
jgi:hypothetical protein